MEFNETDSKFISSNDIVLDVMLTSGSIRLDIYPTTTKQNKMSSLKLSKVRARLLINDS